MTSNRNLPNRNLPTSVEGLSEALRTVLEPQLTGGSEKTFELALYDAVWRLHPTLQQAWFRVLKGFIFAYADIDDRFFDARNEASHEWAKRVSGTSAPDHSDRPNLVGLPLI